MKIILSLLLLSISNVIGFDPQLTEQIIEKDMMFPIELPKSPPTISQTQPIPIPKNNHPTRLENDDHDDDWVGLSPLLSASTPNVYGSLIFNFDIDPPMRDQNQSQYD